MAADRRDTDEARGEELPRGQDQNGTTVGGRQIGGGPGPSDMGAAGGSSGTGGYGNAQNQQLHQGQQQDVPARGRSDERLDRGERFDEQQGGGRGPDAVSRDDLADDQAAHQDRGQTIAETESDRD